LTDSGSLTLDAMALTPWHRPADAPTASA